MPVMLTQRFADAVACAANTHATQTRKGTDLPYMCHLLGVSGLVLEAGGDEDLAIAGLLHDVAEDQPGQPRLEDLRQTFGDRVADIVLGCTEALSEDPDDKAPYVERKMMPSGTFGLPATTSCWRPSRTSPAMPKRSMPTCSRLAS